MKNVIVTDQYIRATVKLPEWSGEQWLEYLRNKKIDVTIEENPSSNRGVFQFVSKNDYDFTSPLRGDADIIIINPESKKGLEEELGVKLLNPYFEIAGLIVDNFEKLNHGNFKQIIIPSIGQLCYDPQGYWLSVISEDKIEDRYFYSGLDLVDQLPKDTWVAFVVAK